MFITQKEVRSYVERAEPGSTVGVCNDFSACLVAEAVKQKYPNVQHICVTLDGARETIDITASPRPGIVQTVTTGDDGTKLYKLAEAFDELKTYDMSVTREEALDLFKEF